ncbi:DUF2798 domain-containing protein [Buttiauxella warmboldiae]|nr:DUF2798 domain-containing protein [Buttiauxella warmboldiae]
MEKRTVLVNQLLMTGIMALSMSGIMLLIALGPSAALLTIWPKQFLVAWPIAFVMTMVAWPLSNKLTYLLCGQSLIRSNTAKQEEAAVMSREN